MATAHRKIGSLFEGDCFFYYTQQQSVERQEQIIALNESRVSRGASALTPDQSMEYFRAAMSGYVVSAVVRATGERCAMRLSDGKHCIFYDNSEQVLYSPNREAFQERVESMKEAQKKMAEEQRKASRHRSKKAAREENEVTAA